MGNHRQMMFNQQRPTGRLARWIIKLQSYEVEHKRGCRNSNADALSRLPTHVSETCSVCQFLCIPRDRFKLGNVCFGRGCNPRTATKPGNVRLGQCKCHPEFQIPKKQTSPGYEKYVSNEEVPSLPSEINCHKFKDNCHQQSLVYISSPHSAPVTGICKK